MSLFRWKAVVPLGLMLLVVAGLWLLLADRMVERTVEGVGARLVGARVDVASADIRLADGVVALRGLAVTNPQRPMTNLFVADEIVVNVRIAPLLEKKILIDTVAVRGLAFGTPRETSGALADTGEAAGAVHEEILAWRARTTIPALSLAGLGQVVDVGAVRADSLTTLRQAAVVQSLADSARTAWTSRVRRLDPQPLLDSARALAGRLEGASLRSLGLQGARDAVTSTRDVVTRLTSLDNRVEGLARTVSSDVAEIRNTARGLAAARRADFDYARSLLRLPSLDAPNLAPSLFGEMVLDQVEPYLYWLRMAERYLPPGIESRLHDGPDRTRRAGTTVLFPEREQLPAFLLELAEATVRIDRGSRAGNYFLRLTDLTSAPTLHGRPVTFALGRTGGAGAFATIRAAGTLNHVGPSLRDSVTALVDGVPLPTMEIGALGARLRLGDGTTELALTRVGDSLDARWSWRAPGAEWERLAPGGAAGGVEGRVAEVLWRAVSGIREVEIEARLTGSLSRPRLAVGSNVAHAVAQSLRRELGAEVRSAERRVRATVDSLVATPVRLANQAVAALDSEVPSELQGLRDEIAAVKQLLTSRIRRLSGIPGMGTP